MNDKICNNCGKQVNNQVKYCPDCKSQSFQSVGEITTSDNNLVHTLFYWTYAEGNILSKSKLISISVFIYLILFWASIGAEIISVLISMMIAGLLFLIGFAIHQIKPKKSLNKIKYNDYGFGRDILHLLFYWQNNNGNFFISKTKLISFLVFMIFALSGIAVSSDDLIFFSAILFGLIFEIPVFVIGYVIHKLTNNDDSKPKLIKNTQINVKPVEKELYTNTQTTMVNEYEKYKNEINQLNRNYVIKEKQVINLIEKRFTPPQLTYTRFIGVVNKSGELFNHQSDSVLNMINIASEYSPKIEDEIKSKINILNTILNKLDDLSNEFILTMDSSSDEEVSELFDDINTLIHSVKDYE